MKLGMHCFASSCDLFGCKFTLHDNGTSPKKFKTGASEEESLRRELMAIIVTACSYTLLNIEIKYKNVTGLDN